MTIWIFAVYVAMAGGQVPAVMHWQDGWFETEAACEQYAKEHSPEKFGLRHKCLEMRPNKRS